MDTIVRLETYIFRPNNAIEIKVSTPNDQLTISFKKKSQWMKVQSIGLSLSGALEYER